MLILVAGLVSYTDLRAELTFSNRTDAANLGFMHQNQSVDPEFEMPVSMSAGVASGDIDNDGDIDLYMARGNVFPNALLINNGNGIFTDIAENAGVALPNQLHGGPVFADINGDGWLDLMVGGLVGSGLKVFFNNKDMTFTNVTEESGIVQESPTQHDYSIALGDPDGDGDLDVYVGHWGSTPGVTHFWMNQGAGTFQKVDAYSGVAGIYADSDASFAPVFADINGDMRQDLLVTSDFDTSHVLKNMGNMHFEDITTDVIDDQAGMGSAVGDFDNDGDMDWFVTAIWWSEGRPMQGNRMYQNDGTGSFTNITKDAGVTKGDWGWGACAADFNNDGWLDIFHVNGMGIEAQGNNFKADYSKLFINRRNGTFYEDAIDLGIEDYDLGRGVVCFDADNDGDIDIFTNSADAMSQFYRNELNSNPGWLQVKLQGEQNNPTAVGAKIELTTGKLKQIREITVGSNYQSQDPLLQHFGLGGASEIEQLKVYWPHGGQTLLENVSINQRITVSAQDSTSPPFFIQPGISAAWVDPALSSEGFVIEILPGGLAALFWFTYDDDGNQDWYIGVGEINGRRILFNNLLSVSGAKFGTDSVNELPIETRVGRAAFTWTGCDSGFMDWELGDEIGHQALARLTRMMGAECGEATQAPVATEALWSGAWVDAERDGEGFVLEITKQGLPIIFYFGFDPDGNRRWLTGVGSVVDDKIIFDNVQTTKGGRFSDPDNQSTVEEFPWGSLVLEIDCESGTGVYSSLEAGFGNGTYKLSRMTNIDQLACP